MKRRSRKQAGATGKTLTTFGCGAGTQSTAMYLLMRDGKIPLPDAVIFADTGNEPADVVANVEYLRDGFERLGVPFYIVGRGLRDDGTGRVGVDITRDVLDRQMYATLPAFTIIKRTIRTPLAWKRCTCDWATVFGIGGDKGVEALGQFYPGTTWAEVVDHTYEHLWSGDCETCRFDSETDEMPDRRALVMLEETEFERVPQPCVECRSAGRIPTKFHTYTKVEKGRIRRECTGKYKIEPIEQQIRMLLGASVRLVGCGWCNATGRRVAPWDVAAGDGPCSVCYGTGTRRLVGRAPAGSRVYHMVGFSKDEFIARASTKGFPRTTTPIYPLTDLGLSRADCIDLIVTNGLTAVRSACKVCSFHGNAYWRDMRDNRPDEWAEVVAFDREFRTMPGLNGERFLHESCVPLDEANIEKPSKAELKSAQGDLFRRREEGSPTGCSPVGCRAEESTAAVIDLGMPMVMA